MTKRYITVSDINLTKSFCISGQEVTVEFTGGKRYPKIEMGRFSTDSQELQQAMESSGRYGIDYTCEVLPATSISAVKLTVVDEITTKQMALEWIENNLDQKFSKSKSDKEIKKFLAESGFVMSNWR